MVYWLVDWLDDDLVDRLVDLLVVYLVVLLENDLVGLLAVVFVPQLEKREPILR